jgi:aquaporin related protein
MKSKEFIQVFLAEVLGTAILLFIGCMGCVMDYLPSYVAHLQICLNFGFAVMICIQIFGVTSGAHINPAVSVAAAIYGLISYQVVYIQYLHASTKILNMLITRVI